MQNKRNDLKIEISNDYKRNFIQISSTDNESDLTQRISYIDEIQQNLGSLKESSYSNRNSYMDSLRQNLEHKNRNKLENNNINYLNSNRISLNKDKFIRIDTLTSIPSTTSPANSINESNSSVKFSLESTINSENTDTSFESPTNYSQSLQKMQIVQKMKDQHKFENQLQKTKERYYQNKLNQSKALFKKFSDRSRYNDVTHTLRTIKNNYNAVKQAFESNHLRNIKDDMLEFSQNEVDELVRLSRENHLRLKDILNVPDDFDLKVSLESDYFYGNIDEYLEKIAVLKEMYDEGFDGQPTIFMQAPPEGYWEWKRRKERIKFQQKQQRFEHLDHFKNENLDLNNNDITNSKPNYKTRESTKSFFITEANHQNSINNSHPFNIINNVNTNDSNILSKKNIIKSKELLQKDKDFDFNFSIRDIKLPVHVPNCLHEHFMERLVIGNFLRNYEMNQNTIDMKNKEIELLDFEINLLKENIAHLQENNFQKKENMEQLAGNLAKEENEAKEALRKSKVFMHAWHHKYIELKDQIKLIEDKVNNFQREYERRSIYYLDKEDKMKEKYEKEFEELKKNDVSHTERDILQDIYNQLKSESNSTKKSIHQVEKEILNFTSQRDHLLWKQQYLIDSLLKWQEIKSIQKPFFISKESRQKHKVYLRSIPTNKKEIQMKQKVSRAAISFQ